MAPFPHPVFQIYTFLNSVLFAEAEIGFLAGTPTINRLEISITRAKQACEFPAAHIGPLPHIPGLSLRGRSRYAQSGFIGGAPLYFEIFIKCCHRYEILFVFLKLLLLD